MLSFLYYADDNTIEWGEFSVSLYTVARVMHCVALCGVGMVGVCLYMSKEIVLTGLYCYITPCCHVHRTSSNLVITDCVTTMVAR